MKDSLLHAGIEQRNLDLNSIRGHLRRFDEVLQRTGDRAEVDVCIFFGSFPDDRNQSTPDKAFLANSPPVCLALGSVGAASSLGRSVERYFDAEAPPDVANDAFHDDVRVKAENDFVALVESSTLVDDSVEFGDCWRGML